MPKINWDGVEEPTINNFYNIDIVTENFEYFKVRIDRSQPQYFISK